MIINEANLAVHTFTGNEDDGRAEISGVYVGNGKTVATDSFRLMSVNAPVVAGEDMPETVKHGLNAPVIVPTSAVKKAIRNIPKNPSIPVLKNIGIATDEGDTVTLSTTDLETADIVKSRTVDGKYPEWQQIMPDGEPLATITVSAKYLQDMAQYFAKYDAGGQVDMAVYGTEKPVKMTGTTKDEQAITGLLMPIRK
jgi:hypothetical protein